MTDSIKSIQDDLNSPALKSITDTLNSSSMKAVLEAARAAQLYEAPASRFKIPHIEPVRIPTPREANSYQSAGVLMKRLADTIASWRQAVPADTQPAIVAILHGGIQIEVSLLAEESFHGIRIEGSIDGSPCMLVAHQSSVQLLCYIVKIEHEEQRRKIGFIIDGQEHEV